jgi:hypothetical protein
MNLSLYLESESFHFQSEDDNDIKQKVKDLSYIVEDALSAGDSFYKTSLFYESSFCLWLWTKTRGMDDEVILLRKLIEKKAHTVELQEYDEVKLDIETSNFSNKRAFISMYNDNPLIWYITNINKLWMVRRYYLNQVSNIDEFLKYVEICFPNLYFHPTVRSSLRTLTHPFMDYKDEIIRHLAAINDYFMQIFTEYEGQGYRAIKDQFRLKTGIDCAPETDRDVARRREYYFDTVEGRKEKVRCELHTKFSTFGKNKDRLYFHQGKENIQNGKILIAHIGDHLQ